MISSFKPGPARIAASALLAGFSESVTYPTVTDAVGKIWKAPSAVLIAVAITGAESSGNAWATHLDSDGSTDFGLWQINNADRPYWFSDIGSASELNWANPNDNAAMAYSVWSDSVTVRKANGEPVTADFSPWATYASDAYLAERFGGRSWVDWAASGILAANAEAATMTGCGISYAAALSAIASVDNDPLVYWEGN